MKDSCTPDGRRRVLRYDDRGNGDPVVLVPGGLTGLLSWIHETLAQITAEGRLSMGR